MGTAKQKISAALTGVLLLLNGCSITAELPQSETTAETTVFSETLPPVTETQLTETQPPETQPQTQLSDEPVFDQMCSGLRQFQESLEISGQVSGEILDDAFYRIGRECPELFWVCGYSATYDAVSASVDFSVLDGLTPDQLSRMAEELESISESVTRQAAAYPSDYEKVLFVHDYIVEHTEYDNAGAAADTNGIWGTAYGCLVNGSAVCQGYAEAFLLIMNQLGIPAGICSGMTEQGLHAWNYVYVNGNYYWLDATWDDPSFTGGGSAGLRHTYFLISDDLLLRSRTIDMKHGGFIPSCTSMSENYFVRSGNYLTGYNFADIDSRLSLAADDGFLEVMFTSREALEAARVELFEKSAVWNAEVFRENTETVQYSTDDEMYVLRIVFTPDDK